MPKRKYTAEFKSRIIIAILQGDKEFNVICSENNLNPNMVRKWKQDFLQNAHLVFDAAPEQKIAQRKESDLKKKNDQMLKTIGQRTWNVIFFRTAFAKLENQSQKSRSLIQKDKVISIRRQCELLGINRSSLYYAPSEPDPLANALDEAIMARIDYWHTALPYLGSRKLVIKLNEDGYPVKRKIVRRLMQKMGIYAIYPKPNLSARNFKEAIVPYLLRNYNVAFSNQVWSIDITYIPMPHGHMYLTAIIDWYSRRIVGRYLSDSLDTEAVIYAVRESVKECGIPAIINSDQGSQFTSDTYKQLLKDLGIRQSMDGKSR